MKRITKLYWKKIYKSGLYNATKTLVFASYFCKMRVKEGNIKFGKYTCNPFEMVLLEDMEILKIYT
jgi:hypothetical protein